MANFVRNVLIDGVKYAVGDKRIEGDNFAYIQVPEAITVGTNLTDLAPIQKALDSTDGSLLYAPSLNALFSPTASSDPTIRIWSSTVGDKGYQLKATLNASGVLQSAVVNEASGEAGLIITEAEIMPVLQQYLDHDPDDFDPTGTYLITDEAKAIANKLVTIDEEVGYIVPDKFQIEISFLSTKLNCVYSANTILENGCIMFKTLGSYPFPPQYEDNIPLELGPVVAMDVLGLFIREIQSESGFNINTKDYKTIYNATQALTTEEYVTTELAKSIGRNILEHYHGKKGWDIDHFTVSTLGNPILSIDPFPLSFYTLAHGAHGQDGSPTTFKFTSTATDSYNGDITFYYGASGCLGMRIDDKPEEFVRISKKYMEIEVDTPETTMKANVTGDTLNLFSVQPAAASKIIHYPESVLFTSDAAFELKFAPITGLSAPYTPDAKIEISKDGLNWTQPVWNETNGISLVADTVNDELGKYSVFIRSDNYINDITDPSVAKVSSFSEVSGTNIEVSGILDAMWGSKAPAGVDAYSMFGEMANLISAKDLVFPNMAAENSYANAFINCTSLIQAPAILPATTLAESSYECMFNNCTSLTHAPVLPIEVVMDYSCHEMFCGCEALITPPTLPASTLAEGCYANMFQDCTALTTPPELPAIVLARNCYSEMFEDCTALIMSPELPATTLAERCYSEMFKGCTALTTPPELPATTLAEGCYAIMFSGCTALTTPPELPATVLAISCYNQMFHSCTKLTVTPELPATALTVDCYYGMFEDCPALTKPVVFPEITTLATDCMTAMFRVCTGIKWAASGTPYIIKTTDGSTVGTYTGNMFAGNTGPFPETAGTPKLNTTYYLEA